MGHAIYHPSLVRTPHAPTLQTLGRRDEEEPTPPRSWRIKGGNDFRNGKQQTWGAVCSQPGPSGQTHTAHPPLRCGTRVKRALRPALGSLPAQGAHEPAPRGLQASLCPQAGPAKHLPSELCLGGPCAHGPRAPRGQSLPGSTLSAEGFVQHQSTFQPVPQSWAKPQGCAHSSRRSPPDTGTPGAVTACVEAADAECQGVVWPHSVTLGRVGPLWASFPTSLGTGLGSQGPTPHTYISMTL